MGSGHETNLDGEAGGRSDRQTAQGNARSAAAGASAEVATPTVLAVDDLPEYLKLYEARLGDAYDVRTAANGEEALESLDDAVDIVLLDRSMPGLSGDDVLERIRDADEDCRVAMVTAVEPDFDIIDLGFDAYLTKPVSKDTLLSTVDRLLTRTTYSETLSELYTLCSKRAVLKRAKDEEELAASEKYQDLQARIAELRIEVDSTASAFERDDYRATFRDLSFDD
ncbi:DNA-binding protein [Halocalculus aciditolerans]|uniref:DNA-binding protein n=1 Tax=Halocalculus aciditolerans TaxID=1383812 RepID=A0A830FMI8_9EURY|nr:DNA-binding protein [Halocalculus aciditolerans]